MGTIHMVVGLLVVCSTAFYAEAADPKPTSEEKKVVCYYTSWSAKRIAPYAFSPDKVDPFLCTHIIYAFADIGLSNNLISPDPDYDIEQRAYANITGLKKINKNLKIMMGIGGYNNGTLRFSQITSNETNRKEFAKNAVRYLRGYMFDGLDLNWQHPTFREGGRPEDRENYVLLAQTLREEFNNDAIVRNKPRLLLSIAITHIQKFLPGYDIANFNTYMDFISVICYDYHFAYEPAVNHHSPLYSLEEDNDYNYDAKVNINYTIQYFMELADPEKLVLGIPTYGRTYKLENPEDTSLGSYADGAGEKGPVTGEKGFFAYFEICNLVKNDNWTVVQTKPGYAGPYAYKGDQWVGYDDVDMIRYKAIYAKEKGLGGVMFWTIDYDDFLGMCQETKFPIIRTARDELNPFASSSSQPGPSSSSSFDSSSVPAPAPSTSTSESYAPGLDSPVSSDAIVFEDDDFVNPGHKPVQQTTPTPMRKELKSVKSPVRGRPSYADISNQFPDGPLMPRVPTATRNSVPPKRPLRFDPTEDTDVSEQQSNLLSELIHLIRKTGGMNNFCKLLRMHKSSLTGRRGFHSREDSDNTITFETADMPPILLVLSNSSVYIKELNVFSKN